MRDFITAWKALGYDDLMNALRNSPGFVKALIDKFKDAIKDSRTISDLVCNNVSNTELKSMMPEHLLMSAIKERLESLAKMTKEKIKEELVSSNSPENNVTEETAEKLSEALKQIGKAKSVEELTKVGAIVASIYPHTGSGANLTLEAQMLKGPFAEILINRLAEIVKIARKEMRIRQFENAERLQTLLQEGYNADDGERLEIVREQITTAIIKGQLPREAEDDFSEQLKMLCINKEMRVVSNSDTYKKFSEKRPADKCIAGYFECTSDKNTMNQILTKKVAGQPAVIVSCLKGNERTLYQGDVKFDDVKSNQKVVIVLKNGSKTETATVKEIDHILLPYSFLKKYGPRIANEFLKLGIAVAFYPSKLEQKSI